MCILYSIYYIPRSAKYFVFLENCPVLGSRHCTCAYTETVDPACRPSIPQQWYWHGTVRQGSVRFNLIEDASATCLFQYSYIIYLCCTVYKPHLVISFVIRALFYYPHGASVANIFIKILRLSLRQCTVFRPGTAGPWLAWAWCNFFLPNIKLF